MKLILGTAQFSQNYGIFNPSITTNFETTKKILNKAEDSGILTLDTSPTYGESQKFIGNSGFRKFRIITKIPSLKNRDFSSKYIDKFISKSLSDLNREDFYGILIHNSKDLFSKKGEFAWNYLKKLKSKGVVKKIGYSIYSPLELDELYDNFKPDIIQAPFNIFDRRINDSGWIDKLSEDKVEFHARSIFLQGLLLMPKNKIPKKFKKWQDNFDKWHNWLKKNNVSALEACLGMVKADKRVDMALFGVKTYSELNEVIETWKKIDINIPKNLSAKDDELIDPSKW